MICTGPFSKQSPANDLTSVPLCVSGKLELRLLRWVTVGPAKGAVILPWPFVRTMHQDLGLFLAYMLAQNNGEREDLCLPNIAPGGNHP